MTRRANAGDARAERPGRGTAVAGVGTVAVSAAVISYSHVMELARRAGETRMATWLLPLSIDGAIAAAVAVILADSRAGRRPRGLTCYSWHSDWPRAWPPTSPPRTRP